ncbi:uncharacterized protein LOC108913624 isoform X2 [Anoplophora glabripennis]|uniref:uncharacterized protein LOC108913624 isoform X2 n=1 Tax=Anoplophora glabripennis TaxID=217634 RepID=UPI0008747A6B|nr:uncharacterized protein LOC108913624 isoform X2 [Anoplophora glabripennis]
MSVSRIILCVVAITYGANAVLLSERNSDELPLGPYYDTLGDYYVEDPFAEAFSTDGDSLDVDYRENNWDHSNEIFGRQLPESGELKLNQDKKSQIWCKVKKVIKHHHEPGYEFFPKSYSEYDCLPHTHADGFSENSIFSSDICQMHHGRCVSIQKQYFFLKRKFSEKCWRLTRETIKVGCKCIPPKPN